MNFLVPSHNKNYSHTCCIGACHSQDAPQVQFVKGDPIHAGTKDGGFFFNLFIYLIRPISVKSQLKENRNS